MRSQNIRSKQNNQSSRDENYYAFESLGVCITVTTIYLIISLYSHHHHHSNIFFYASDDMHPIYNWGGMVGAYFAAMLYHILGAGAYFFIGALSVLSYMLLLGYRRGRTWVSLLWLPVCVAAACLVVSLYDIDFVRGLPGGMVGETLNHFLTHYVGFYGAAMIGWAVLWVSHVMVLHVSLVRGTLATIKNIATSRLTFFF